MARKVIVLIICFVLTVCLFDCDEHNHQYKDGEEIIAWMNTVGPYHNRQENYPYFSLPFCAGGRKEISHRHETISEHLLGMELEYSGLEIKFKNDVTNTNFCSIASTPDQLRQFIDAINRDYWYEMLIDDLPAYSEVGFLEHENGVYNLYTHKLISLSYNNDRIIEFNLTVANPQPLIFGSEIWFSYKVTWSKSNLNYDQRFNKYLDTKFFGHQIHWFSILNSFMMVQFLVCFVFMILSRTLRHDFARYGFVNDGDVNSLNTEPRSDYERSIVEEYGWKQVQGDVFRPPRKAILLASLLGTGLHISTCLLLLIIVTIIGRLYTKLSSMIGAGIFLYAILSPINGFFGASYYSQWNGKNWIKQMITGILLFPMLFAIAGFSINLIAVCSGNTRAIPLLTILSLIATMCLIVAPLNLVGTLFGRATSGTIVDTRILKFNAIPRPVPEKPWYLRTFTMNILGGILPFGSIFIEMYFIFSSFWAYRIYYVYGFMLLVFIMLVIVTSCVAVVSTYFLLNAEDHYWHWSSFMVGASVSIYVYIYSIYYFYSRTRMSGLFQVTFYFSYMALFCNILGIMCGTFGYLGANASFVFMLQMGTTELCYVTRSFPSTLSLGVELFVHFDCDLLLVSRRNKAEIDYGNPLRPVFNKSKRSVLLWASLLAKRGSRTIVNTSASTQWRSEEASVTHLYSDPIANGNLRQSLQVRQTQSQQAYRGRADNQQLPTNSTTLCNILGANSLCQIVDPRWNAQVAHSSLNYAANRKKSQHSSASLVSEKNGAHSKAFNIEHNQSTQNVHQYKLSRSKAVDGVAEVQLHCSNEQKSRLQSHAEKKIIYHPTNLHVQNVDSIDPKMICKKSINRRTGQIAVATTNTGLKFLLNLNIFNTHSALEIPNPKRKEPRMSDIKSLNNYYFSMPIPTNAELLEYKMSNLDLNANETRVAQPQTIVEYKFTEMAKSAIFTSRDVKSETIKERLESKLEEQRKAQEIITDMDPWEEEYVARMAATKQSKNTRKSKTTEMTARERFWAFAGLEKPSSDEFS